MLTFAASGERDETLFWRDVTAEMVKDFTRRPDDDDEIGLIAPQEESYDGRRKRREATFAV